MDDENWSNSSIGSVGKGVKTGSVHESGSNDNQNWSN